MPFNNDQFTHIAEVAKDLADLRRCVRTLTAVSNADPVKWFGGSEPLQAMVQHAHIVTVAMWIRRHHDKAWANEKGVVSVRRLLRDLGKRAAERELIRNEHIIRTERYATKQIAHGLYSHAIDPTSFADIFFATDALCRLFRDNAFLQAYGSRESAFDWPGSPSDRDDPWVLAVRAKGIPLVDGFDPVDIFVDRSNLSADLRNPNPPPRPSSEPTLMSLVRQE